MGLISRVSSRTYRRKKIIMSKRTRMSDRKTVFDPESDVLQVRYQNSPSKQGLPGFEPDTLNYNLYDPMVNFVSFLQTMKLNKSQLASITGQFEAVKTHFDLIKVSYTSIITKKSIE